MKNLATILIVLIVFLSGLILVTVLLQRGGADTETVEPEWTVPAYTGDVITLPTQGSESAVVKNFLEDDTVHKDEYNQGSYYLGNTFTDEEPPAYVINYQSDSGYFNIALLTEPFSLARYQAELYLEDLLQVTDQSELCNIPYTVSVPGYVDEAASGVDYRFSFCADTVELP